MFSALSNVYSFQITKAWSWSVFTCSKIRN